MRFSIFAAVAAFSSTVFSQGLEAGLPKCAQDCYSSNVGTCSPVDIGCICKSEAISQISCCVLSSCNQADIDSTITLATALCKGSGVDLNTNPSCPSGSSASSSASATASQSSASAASASASASSASASGSAAPAASTAAAPFQSAGAGLGLSVAMVGLLAAL